MAFVLSASSLVRIAVASAVALSISEISASSCLTAPSSSAIPEVAESIRAANLSILASLVALDFFALAHLLITKRLLRRLLLCLFQKASNHFFDHAADLHKWVRPCNSGERHQRITM